MKKPKIERSKTTKKSQKSKDNMMVNFKNLIGGSKPVKTPKGFREIPFIHALMEYSKPLFDRELSSHDKMNAILNIGQQLWNYHIGLQGIHKTNVDRNSIKKAIIKHLKYSETRAEEFIDEMLERKTYLFPPEMQPAMGLSLLMRVEKEVVIEKFDYNRLTFSEEELPPDSDDTKAIEALKQMDKFIEDEVEYEVWESSYFEMEDLCTDAYSKWLQLKGIKEYSDVFSHFSRVFLNFVYMYGHNQVVLVKNVPLAYLSEFFESHVIRKTMFSPEEYVLCPPAIKYFYTFLKEKKYISSVTDIHKKIDTQETKFIKILKQRG